MTQKRKFLGVHYQCCNVYARAYVNKDGTKYEGTCPRCGRRVEMKIGGGRNTVDVLEHAAALVDRDVFNGQMMMTVGW